MKKLTLILLVSSLVGGFAGAGYGSMARRILGTPKADVLRGTRAADTIDGRAGSDRLFGLAGNDILIGGPGNDRLVGGVGKDVLRCGGGKDTAVADAQDVVSSDCESINGLPPAEPPTSEPPPPPPPPAAPLAKPGHYCGFTNQGKSICFDVTPDGTHVSSFDTTSDVDCGVGILRDVELSFAGFATIQANLTFLFAYEGPLQTSPGSPVSNVTANYKVSGTLDTAGNGSGTLSLNRFSFDYQGKHYDCAAASYGWQARAGA